jgi:hypothetical protein
MRRRERDFTVGREKKHRFIKVPRLRSFALPMKALWE